MLLFCVREMFVEEAINGPCCESGVGVELSRDSFVRDWFLCGTCIFSLVSR